MLFGANDSGKSNILDAIEAWIEGHHSRGSLRDPDTGEEDLLCDVEFELDGLGITGHADEKLFSECADSFLERFQESGPELREAIDSIRSPLVETEREEVPPSERAAAIAEFISRFFDFLEILFLAYGSDVAKDWESVEEDFTLVVRAYLRSRRFRWSLWSLDWLAPHPGALTSDIRESQRRLASAAWEDSSESTDPVLAMLGGDPDVLIEMLTEIDPQEVCSVSRVELSARDYERLLQDIEAFIR